MATLPTLGGGFSWQSDAPLAWPVQTDVGPGLRGVIAGETEVSWLDPAAGILLYRGIPVERLAGAVTFEEVAYLLIAGKTAEASPDPEPSTGEAAFASFCDQLRSSRALPEAVVALLRSIDPAVHPTRILRAGVSALGYDELSGNSLWRELRIVGQVAALVAHIACHRRSAPLRAAANRGSLAQGMLQALTGATPAAEDVRLLDTLWVLYADHGLDAPSFTSMVVASCHADPYYNVVAGLSALRGPQLGGATESVLEQLLPLRSADEARAWVRSTVAAGQAIAGFGHRMYTIPDPRAVVLRRELAIAARRRGQAHLFAVARAVEDEATMLLAPKGVHINLNFYAALLFHLLGAQAPLVPCLYAVGRMAGLLARVREVLAKGRLYRPLSRYVGPAPRCMPGVDHAR